MPCDCGSISQLLLISSLEVGTQLLKHGTSEVCSIDGGEAIDLLECLQ